MTFKKIFAAIVEMLNFFADIGFHIFHICWVEVKLFNILLLCIIFLKQYLQFFEN